MTNKKPNFIIKFDGKETSCEERSQGILDLARVLQRLELEGIQNSKDILEEEKAEILSGIYSEKKEFFKFIGLFNEDFETISSQDKKKYGCKKPRGKVKG